MNEALISHCRQLLAAYKDGSLGDCRMPEDANPGFSPQEQEKRLTYFTLPMSINYQRDSYKLWEAAGKTFSDPDTADVFSLAASATMPLEELRRKLLKHKLALQPQKHISTWRTIAETLEKQWGTIGQLFTACHHDFLELKEAVQQTHKKGFPYLSGPKIFHYWSFVMNTPTYGGINLVNHQYIDIAPDTHITKCSVRLGVITQEEADTWSREEISQRWRELLAGSGIDPIDMHPPLWFWSRNDFRFRLALDAVAVYKKESKAGTLNVLKGSLTSLMRS